VALRRLASLDGMATILRAAHTPRATPVNLFQIAPAAGLYFGVLVAVAMELLGVTKNVGWRMFAASLIIAGGITYSLGVAIWSWQLPDVRGWIAIEATVLAAVSLGALWFAAKAVVRGQPEKRPVAPAGADAALWPADPLERLRMAANLGRLVLRWQWVNRRVETFDMLTETQVRRHVSVDFTVPEDLPSGPAVFPLTFLVKRNLRAFDIADESKATLPILTELQTQRLSIDMFVILAKADLNEARGRLRLPEAALSDGVVRDIESIVSSPGAGSVRNIFDLYERAAERDDLERQLLWASNRVQQLMRRLADNFLLCVLLVVEPNKRRIVKYTYLSSFEVGTESNARKRQVASRIAELSKKYKRDPQRLNAEMMLVYREYGINPNLRQSRSAISSGLGLEPWRVEIPDAVVRSSSSYHAELSAPPGLEISDAELRDENNILDRDSERRSDGQIVHLHPRGVPAGPPTDAAIGLSLRLDSGGILQQAVLTSALTTGVILAGVLLGASYVARMWLQVHPAPAAAGALLLAVPGALSIVAASQEHRLVRKFVNVIRWQLLLSALCSFGAACSLAVTDLPQYLRLIVWIALLALSATNTVLLVIHWSRTRMR
jgi:hypothetical protein